MIAVPWYIVDEAGGSALATLAAGVAFFGVLWMPISGYLVDRFPRKHVLMTVQGAGCLMLLAASILDESLAIMTLLTMVFVFGSLMYGLWYPALIAYVQELLPSSMHGKANGYLEVQGQVSMMVAGFAGGRMVEHVELSTIFAIDAGTFALSCILFALLPLFRPDANVESRFFASLKAGFVFLRDRPRYLLFFAASLVPFLIVMVANAVMPAHISDYLQFGADVFGDLELSWGLGSAIAGFVVPHLLKHNNRLIIAIGITVFAIVQFVFSQSWTPIVLFVCAATLGLCNAGIRVVRNTLLMKFTPKEIIGRANTAFYTIVKLLQGAFLLTVAGVVTGATTHWVFASFAVLAFVSAAVAFLAFPRHMHSQS